MNIFLSIYKRIILNQELSFRSWFLIRKSSLLSWFWTLKRARNKKSVISVDILLKYRISASTDTILLTESRLGKKIGKIVDISAKYRALYIT